MTNSIEINTPINRQQQCLLFNISLECTALQWIFYFIHIQTLLIFFSFSFSQKNTLARLKRKRNKKKRRMPVACHWHSKIFNSLIQKIKLFCYSKHLRLVKTIATHQNSVVVEYLMIEYIFFFVSFARLFSDLFHFECVMWSVWNVLHWTTAHLLFWFFSLCLHFWRTIYYLIENLKTEKNLIRKLMI